MKALKDMPSFLGEKDVMKSLMLLPGVQQGSEGNAGIYVSICPWHEHTRSLTSALCFFELCFFA
jgi:hypothetical protein